MYGGQHVYALHSIEKFFIILGLVGLVLYAIGYFAENIEGQDLVSQLFKLIAVGVRDAVNSALSNAWKQITGGG